MVWCQPARSLSWQDGGMERVLGIGGYFMRAADPVALGAWYRDCLGLDADENCLWRQEAVILPPVAAVSVFAAVGLWFPRCYRRRRRRGASHGDPRCGP